MTEGTGRRVTVATAPPAVPASRIDEARPVDVHLLLWVYAGTAHVETGDGGRHRLGAGDGIWLPAGGRRSVGVDAGSVAFPYELPRSTTPSAPPHPIRFAVPDRWRDWLILHFTHGISPISSVGVSQDAVLDVLRAPHIAPQHVAAPPVPDRPALPAAPGARLVAEQIRADPALDRSVETWAAVAACSVSTLSRGFLATGHPFTRWRTLTRLAAARDLLAAGHDVQRIAALVGYSSRNGFTRAFGEHHGITPREYAALASDPVAAPSEQVAAERGRRTLEHLLGRPARPADAPGHHARLPPGQTPPHTNDHHVLGWTYRGEGFLRLDGTTHVRRRGDAIWIPAGVEHRAGTHGDSISMPVADVPPCDARFPEPVRTHFPPAWDTYLLHRSISLRTSLRPPGFDPRDVLEIFRDQFAAERARSVAMPASPRAREAATAFLRDLRTPPGPPPDPAIAAAFREETGMTFSRWRHATRMRLARELLEDGARPSTVARRLGYRHLRNFTRAFTTAHGIPPSRYRHP